MHYNGLGLCALKLLFLVLHLFLREKHVWNCAFVRFCEVLQKAFPDWFLSSLYDPAVPEGICFILATNVIAKSYCKSY